MTKLFSFILLVNLLACSPAPETTRVVISNFSSSSEYPLYLNAFNGSSYVSALLEKNSEEFIVDLPNGQWITYGSQHYEDSGGFIKNKCIYRQVELSGGTQHIELDLDSKSCENNSLNNIAEEEWATLIIVPCEGGGGEFLQDACIKHQAGASHRIRGNSVRVSFVAQSLHTLGNNETIPTNKVVSMPRSQNDCKQINDQQSPYGSFSYMAYTDVKVPIQQGLKNQLPWKIRVEIYNLDNCSGFAQTYDFDFGISELNRKEPSSTASLPVPTNIIFTPNQKTYTTYFPTGSLLHLFLSNTPLKDGEHGCNEDDDCEWSNRCVDNKCRPPSL